MNKILQYETFVVVGLAMVVLTFLKLMGIIEISSDWFWLIAGVGLVIEGYLNIRKKKQFDGKYKVISKKSLKKSGETWKKERRKIIKSFFYPFYMKKLFIFLFFLIPLISGANIEYTLTGNDALVEIEMSFEEIEKFEFPSEVEYSEGIMKYVEKNSIEKSGEEYFFIQKSEIFPNSKIKVVLPEGAYLNEKYFVFPQNYSISTNGKNIILEWTNSQEKEILVPYKIKSMNYLISFLILISLIGIFFYLYWLKKTKKTYTQNLFKEEKKIMDYLLKKKECWTKEISRDLEIPKVRLSRKLRNLQERGLIEKIPYGNENKIKIKK